MPSRTSDEFELVETSNRRSNHRTMRSVSSSYDPVPTNAARHARSRTTADTVTQKFSLTPNPRDWGSNISPYVPEPDDAIHNPDPKKDATTDRFKIFTKRGLTNMGCLLILLLALLGLFIGYPISRFVSSKTPAFNDRHQAPVQDMGARSGLIDPDTPQDAREILAVTDGQTKMKLVFSDEFNTDGRTFYAGDDPYWEAEDFHYWGTNNLEWYDPAAITTKNGSLAITLSKRPPEINHNLTYQGGLMTTWNKFCFTGGAFYASVNLPGASNVLGLWPAVWAVGNLGRAGYGATLDGMWPYTYDSCDVGTVKNQSLNGLPAIASTGGIDGGPLSFQPGQRLSRCTCQGESHPGPAHADGSYVGRSAPEIDVIEAQVQNGVGFVSQSLQLAPFNVDYDWFNTSDNLIIYDPQVSKLNPYYKGGVYQQATSGLSETDQRCYELESPCFSTYAFEYKPGFDGGYITWVSNGKPAWTIRSEGLAADARAQISARPIPQEPMYLIVNLGISEQFGGVDWDHITFPATMTVDWIRVYQDENNVNVGCDPEDFPTRAYIKQYEEAYSNPNLTTWNGPRESGGYGQPMPKNNLVDSC
ncbi:hypothetical protein D9758_012135 [Tetrapyrgos nigripes]|uniref:GH16 domain-containing protein n=1 Tax=Tetrapyrgos nigripes TaxID=182062 RepID=A0A8H5FNN5_9AGAR|nr:hypothetical protein D9758_012135 [Tetrapyrgos nigripes]